MTTRYQLDVWINPQRMGGAACITGTRVPAGMILDYLELGEALETLEIEYPGIKGRITLTEEEA